MDSIIDSSGFAKIFGTTPEDVEDVCGDILSKYDFRYTFLGQTEFESTLLEILKTIDSQTLSVSGKGRQTDWEYGWNENLKSFIESNYDLSVLIPKYMHKFQVKRLFSRYIRPYDKAFEINFYNIYRHYLFRKYLGQYHNVYEFGCGTGYNLVIMARLFPNMSLTGLDWASSSVKLVEAISSAHHFNLKGRRFDYFDPDYDLTIEDNSVVITLNSMEQVGENYHHFLKFVLEKKPSLCINSEPFIELYNENNLLDYLAVKYHRKRSYLNGYLTDLKKLEKDKKIEILKIQRVPFGSIFHEGYSFVVWKVL